MTFSKSKEASTISKGLCLLVSTKGGMMMYIVVYKLTTDLAPIFALTW